MVAARGAAARRGTLLLLLTALGSFRLRLARAGEYLLVPPTPVSVSSPFPRGCSCPLLRRTLVQLLPFFLPHYPHPHQGSASVGVRVLGWSKIGGAPVTKPHGGFSRPAALPGDGQRLPVTLLPAAAGRGLAAGGSAAGPVSSSCLRGLEGPTDVDLGVRKKHVVMGAALLKHLYW